MQQNTYTVIEEDNLQAVTGGMSDGAAAIVSTGASGSVIGAAAGAAAMRRELNNRVKNAKDVFNAQKKVSESQMHDQHKTLSKAQRGARAVASRAANIA